MSRVANILLRARDSLADHAGQRWTDARLLRLVDEAQKDIARHSKLLKGVHDISLSIDVHTYELPPNVHLITRAAFGYYELALVSYDLMDEQANKVATNSQGGNLACWELDSASYVDRLIFDNRNMGEIRVYPTPDIGIVVGPTYDFEEVVGGLLGVVSSLDDYEPAFDFLVDHVYGVITSLSDPAINDEEFEDVYGVLTDIHESKGIVRIWYTKIPEALETLQDELELPTMYDTAIRLYVVGNAFLDDNDAAYRQKGTDTLGMYDRELNLAKTTGSMEGVRNPAALTTSYRGPFE